MTRRDMIVLAVLVNAGLLAIIFLLAINTDDEKLSDSFEMTPSVVALKGNETNFNETSISPVIERPRDEVDSALREFADSSAFQPTIEEELYPYAVLDQEELQNADSIQEVEITPEPAKNLKYVEVTVKKGDVLEKIARANGTTVSAIKDANQLKNERLNIGQVLRVPVTTPKKTETAVAKTTPTPAAPIEKKPAKTTPNATTDAQYYTIKNGDNPWKIAKQFGVKVDDLLKLNGWNEEKARNLKVGDKIRIS